MASSSKLTTEDWDQFNTLAQSAALKATRNAAALPADIVFHRAMDSSFASDLDSLSARVLLTTNRLLSLVNPKGGARVESTEDLVDNFHSVVVDSVDRLFEQTDSALDIFLGRVKAPAISVNPIPRPKKNNGKLTPAIQSSGQLSKPQQAFSAPVDNSDSPWVPNLRHKFHAMVPLGYVYHDDGEHISDEVIMSSHPYRYEIKHIPYPQHMFKHAEPIPSIPLTPENLTQVSSKTDLLAMIDVLKTTKEIAVDLEHHSYRTYAGFLCLMQISTRERDYIVDLLIPDVRAELAALGEVFADPSIVKVFHGADSDIVWLQQDFCLYIVNLFDTFHASKILDFPRHGLANLLEMYCDFSPDKSYQLADWRIRPLPDAMIDYARSDTHFLLYIYDNLRNALLDKAESRAASQERQKSQSPHGSPHPTDRSALVREVLSRSEATALRRYVKETYDFEQGSGSNGWDGLAKKWNKGELMAGDGANVLKREIFRCVHQWRDRVSREEDESPRFVLPHHIIFAIAERPPEDVTGLFGMWKNQNHGGISNVIKRRASELVAVIREARTRAMQGSVPEKAQEASEVSELPVHIPPPVVEPNETAERPVSTTTGTDRLWGLRASFTAPRSQLLSATLKNSTTYKTQHSALLGPDHRHSPAETSVSTRFNQVVARIHETLQIAATLPKVDTEGIVSSNEEASSRPTESDTGMQVEIPFIPATQRTTKVQEGAGTAFVPLSTKEKDTIVIVGQRQKKRKGGKMKRSRVSPVGDEDEEPSPSTKKPRQNPETVEPFDYASVPNILDDVEMEGEGEKVTRKDKKKKLGKDAAYTYGDFSAPPKARSEFKGGNKTSTFTK